MHGTRGIVFDRITIVGLGLVGGSLGMAIRRRRLAKTVVGLSRNASTLRAARRCGAIDVGTTDARRAVEGADLVVLATPVDTIVPYAKRLGRWMKPGSVLSDVGSVKGQIVRSLERAMPRGVAFIGAHPLAGSERRGIAAADARLFSGSTVVLTPTRRTNRRALRSVRQLWQSLTSRVVAMDPERHDRLLAAVSHLPHALAFSLVAATDAQALAIAPRSFLDATRVAQSDPGLWEAIFLQNDRAVVAGMDRFERQWRLLRRTIARGDRSTLHRLLASVQSTRNAVDEEAHPSAYAGPPCLPAGTALRRHPRY